MSEAIRNCRTVGRLWMGMALAASLLTAQTGTQELRLTVGKSVAIDYPSDISRISTSNPDVVDAVPISARELLLNAKAFGQSTVVVWSKTGERSFFAVQVEANLEPMQRLLKETFPNETIEVRATRDSATLSGRVSSPAVAERAMAVIAPLVKSVVNNMLVAPGAAEKQIVLRVRFAELNRTAVKEFGVNLFSTGATNTIGRVGTGQYQGPSIDRIRSGIPGQSEGFITEFAFSDLLQLFAFRPDLNLGATIKALEQQQLLQILAEPNLVTTNGKEASFLAGGEFPVPVLQGGASSGAITIQFKEFGIRLQFTPNMTPHDTIKMHVKSELSTIDLINAVTFFGFTIPALSTRKAETDIELAAGQSFVVGGLLDDRTRENLFQIPGLASIPVLGHLFRSRQVTKTKTELIVLVTPEVVNPLNPSDPRPVSKMFTEGMPAHFPGAIRDQAAYEEALRVEKQDRKKVKN